MESRRVDPATQRKADGLHALANLAEREGRMDAARALAEWADATAPFVPYTDEAGPTLAGHLRRELAARGYQADTAALPFDAGRAAGLRDLAGGAQLVELPAGSDRERVPVAPDADLSRGPVAFEANDRCESDPQSGRDLLGDRGEDLGAGRLLCDERRDAPQ